MFDRTPDLYDAFYDVVGKDYEAEAHTVLAAIRSLNPTARSLLDVACGTGRHLGWFSKELWCVGVDLDAGLLDVARERCPKVRFAEADMADLDLGERFDAVVCLFSSIGYVRTPERLDRAVAAMARHLAPGGVLVVEPSFKPDEWVPGRVMTLHVDEPELQAVRMSLSGREDDVAIIDFAYLVGRDGAISHHRERHELGLFHLDRYVTAFGTVRSRGDRGRGGPDGAWACHGRSSGWVRSPVRSARPTTGRGCCAGSRPCGRSSGSTRSGSPP